MGGQTRDFYDKTNYQNRYRLNIRDKRIQFSDRIQYGQTYKGTLRYNQNNRNGHRRENFRGNVTGYQYQNFMRQNNRHGYRHGYRGKYRNDNYERGRSRSRERSYSGSFRRMTEVTTTVGPDQDQKQVLIKTELGVLSVESMIIS